jgi:hypothetical protein
MKTFYFLLFFLAFECSYSQNVILCGKVTDLDKNPIEFVSIKIATLNSKVNQYTDENGFFCLKNIKKGPVKLNIKFFKLEVDTVLLFSEKDSVFLNFEANLKMIVCRSILCGINDSIAQIDITEGIPRLLIEGGLIAKKIHGQEMFEAKYGIKYYDFGCISLDKKSIISYNKVIFNYLDNKYGRKWRKEVRKDVLGL